MENLVSIGKIIGTHHLDGAVKVNTIFTDIDVIINEKVMIIKNENRKILTIKSVKRLNTKKLIVKFEEIENIDKAKALNNYEIKIRRDLLPTKDNDDFYLGDLLGVEVYENGDKIGNIIDTLETGAHDIIIVSDDNQNEIMIPFVDKFIKKVDFKNNRIDVELLEGMRE